MDGAGHRESAPVARGLGPSASWVSRPSATTACSGGGRDGVACGWHQRVGCHPGDPYQLDALCSAHVRLFIDALLRVTPFTLVVTTNDLLCVVAPPPSVPAPPAAGWHEGPEGGGADERGDDAVFAVFIAKNTCSTSGARRRSAPPRPTTLLARFLYEQHALKPARLCSVSPFLAAVCTSCPTAQVQAVCTLPPWYLTHGATPPPPPRIGASLRPRLRPLDMRYDMIVHRAAEDGAGSGIVMTPHQRFLGWALDVRVCAVAQTLSCIFMQTHMPDPRLPDAGVLTLFSMVTQALHPSAVAPATATATATAAAGESLSSPFLGGRDEEASAGGGASLWIADLARSTR